MKSTLLYVALAVTLAGECLSFTEASRRCPKNFTKIGRQCYFFGVEAKTWWEAQTACALLQSTLVNVNAKHLSKSLLDKIKKLKGDENAAYWTSGIDYVDGVTRKWHWFDTGKEFGPFVNWCPGEPNDVGGKEHCMHLVRKGDQFCWNDLNCFARVCPGCIAPNQPISYICQSHPIKNRKYK